MSGAGIVGDDDRWPTGGYRVKVANDSRWGEMACRAYTFRSLMMVDVGVGMVLPGEGCTSKVADDGRCGKRVSVWSTQGAGIVPRATCRSLPTHTTIAARHIPFLVRRAVGQGRQPVYTVHTPGAPKNAVVLCNSAICWSPRGHGVS